MFVHIMSNLSLTQKYCRHEYGASGESSLKLLLLYCRNKDGILRIILLYITYIMHYYMPDVSFMEILMSVLMYNEDFIMS